MMNIYWESTINLWIWDVHQLSLSGAEYDTTHHHTSFAEIVDFKDAVPFEPLIPASVDTCFLQHES
jgi:hypothetical protein